MQNPTVLGVWMTNIFLSEVVRGLCSSVYGGAQLLGELPGLLPGRLPVQDRAEEVIRDDQVSAEDMDQC